MIPELKSEIRILPALHVQYMISRYFVASIKGVFLKYGSGIDNRLMAKSCFSMAIGVYLRQISPSTHDDTSVINSPGILQLSCKIRKSIQQQIICPQEVHPVAGNMAKPFIHGIVDPFVRFTSPKGDSCIVFFEDIYRAVSTAAVYHDNRDIRIPLTKNAVQTVLESVSRITGYNNDGNLRQMAGCIQINKS